MNTFRDLLHSLKNDNILRELSAEETQKLRKVLMEAYTDLMACCEKHHLTMMLAGGSALGAVRHQGFIPWDDDLDVLMPRGDFEKLKEVFEDELGARYILSAPNYSITVKGRFPMMLVKDTVMADYIDNPDDELAKIKLDIFLIENIPENKIVRTFKGIWCTILMAAAGYVYFYEHSNDRTWKYMSKTEDGKRTYLRRQRIGRLLSFYNAKRWFNIIDKAFQYKKETRLLGVPSGRGHYFGEIRPRSTFLPTSKGTFEGMSVNLPGNPRDYLSNLLGADYMTVPPEEKRERHYIIDIRFNG